jgi:hypothetical protein
MDEPQAIKVCLNVIDQERQTWERFLRGAENEEQRTYAAGALQAAETMQTWIKAYSKKGSQRATAN